MATRPPSRRLNGRDRRSASSAANSSFTSMRIAWNTRATVFFNSSSGRLERAARIAWASSRVLEKLLAASCGARIWAWGSSEFSRRISASSPGVRRSSHFDAGIPLAGFIRMSSGPACLLVKPRAGLSSCMEDTPRSARIISAPSAPIDARAAWMPAKFDFLVTRHSSPKPSPRSRDSVRGNSIGSASSPRRRPLGWMRWRISWA